MNELVLQPRLTDNSDWETLLFIFCFATLAFTKSIFGNRFNSFSRLLFSDKYLIVYRESNNFNNAFSIALFFVQIISFSFFIKLSMNVFGFGIKNDWLQYIQIGVFLLLFILLKFLIEKIIAASFRIEKFVNQFNHQKLAYRTYIAIILLPINMLFYYYENISVKLLTLIIVLIMIFNTVTYVISIKKYQSKILSKLFYFILYLCTLEIAPYYFMYYWFTKGVA